MAEVKYTIEQIGEVVKLENVTEKDMTICKAVLVSVKDAMTVKNGNAADAIADIEKHGLKITAEQKKEIERSYAGNKNYPADMLKSIKFWGNQTKTMGRMLDAISK